jgi:hypothetical protein
MKKNYISNKSILKLLFITLLFLTAHLSFSQCNVWTQKDNFGGGGRTFAVGFCIGTKGYIGTGNAGVGAYYNDFWEYDPITNAWSQKANFGGASRSAAVGFSIGTKGYIGTGTNGSSFFNDFWEYDPSSNIWTQKANLSGPPRSFAVGFCIGNKGYLGTGYNNGPNLNDFWEYDPGTDSWMQKANFGGAQRRAATGFSIATKGYIGIGIGSSYFNDFWEFDPSTNIWLQKANFNGAYRYGAVGFCIGNKGYLGTGIAGSLTYNDFWEYTPATNVWIQKANFGGVSRSGAVGFSIGNKGYLGTGNASTLFYNDFWEYVPGLLSDNSVFITKTKSKCNVPSGTATVNVIGGTPPYTYLWNTVPTQTTQTATGLTIGSYTVSVTDSLNCPAIQKTFIIENYFNPHFYDSIQSSSCNISGNGFIKLYNGNALPINGTGGIYGFKPFISEYYNGAGNDKAVEIYNPTNSVIDLSAVSSQLGNAIVKLVNQSNNIFTFPAGSLVQPYGTFVVAHPLANPNILLKAKLTSTVIDGTSLSMKGTIGVNTTIADYAYITTTQTNRRKATVTAPNTTLTLTEWLSYSLNPTNLGAHGPISITTLYNPPNTVIQWDANANNQIGAVANNLNPGTYNYSVTTYTYTLTDTIPVCQYTNQVTVPSLGLDNFSVNFNATQTLFTAPPFVAQFSNTTPNSANYNFTWDFGDGTLVNSNNASVFHQYQYNGLYTVKLIATAISTLCKDTLIKPDYIFCTGGVTCNLTATLSTPSTTSICIGDSILLSCTNTGGVTYQWYINGAAINGAVSANYIATQSGNYQVAVTNSVCTDFSNQVSLTFIAQPQAPTITSNGNLTQCSAGSVVLNATTGYTSYLWSNGAIGQSNSVANSGIYTVTAYNTFGCGATSSPYLLNFSLAPATPICLVTVDTTSLYNQLIWDKPTTTTIDSFRIYRETMTNTFSYLNSVAYDSLSLYNDFFANPNVTSYKYKITALDTCGHETLLSNYHNTIHLQYLGSGNLQWTVYTIENEQNPVLYYTVLRDDNSTGNFLPISSTIPGGNSTFTDINFSSYPNAAYRVDVVWSRNCVPSRILSPLINTSISRSNVKRIQSSPNGLSEIDLNKFVSIFPNPASSIINVKINTALIKNSMLELYDITGKLIVSQKIVNEDNALNINALSNGIYTVRILSDNKQLVKRIIKNQ